MKKRIGIYKKVICVECFKYTDYYITQSKVPIDISGRFLYKEEHAFCTCCHNSVFVARLSRRNARRWRRANKKFVKKEHGIADYKFF